MRAAALAFLVLVGCVSQPGYIPPVPGAGTPDGEFSPCDPPCGPGSACVNLGCVRTDAGTDAASDLPPVFALDVLPPSCCPLGRPGCGCTSVGGTRLADGGCRQFCDRVPTGWFRATDLQGCDYWVAPTISCATLDGGADASMDAGDAVSVDAVSVDATRDAAVSVDAARDVTADHPGG